MNQESGMHFKTRRTALFALVTLFIAAVAMNVVERLERLTAAANEVITTSHEVMEKDDMRAQLANDIRFHAEHGADQLALLFVQKEKAQRVPIYGEMDKHSVAIDQAVARLAPLLASDDGKELLARLVKLRETLRENLQETVDALELDDREKAEALLSTVTRDNLQDLRRVVDQLIKGQLASMVARQKEAQERRSAAEANLSRSRTVVIGAGLIAAMTGLALGLILARKEPALG